MNQLDLGPLIAVPVSLSPFAKWKKKHGIKTHEDKPYRHAGDYARWCASPPHEDFTDANPDDCGYGNSEEEACYEVARQHRLAWLHGKVPPVTKTGREP